MSRELNDIQHTLDRCQNIDPSGVTTYDYYQSQLGSGQQVRLHQLNHDSLQVKNIDKTLNIFYDTLKWIENAAVDLKFQVEEVEDRIGYARGQQQYLS